ncbi:MAG: tetratricopeptide repeat protein [Cyanobacteria bacterium]|nr:tetratricopeptide repeat protein [Cyanobacteriota bacterium]
MDEKPTQSGTVSELKSSPEVLLQQGNALHLQGKFNEATAFYQKAIEQNPDLPIAHNDLGAAYYQLGKIDDAIACFRIAIKLNPDYPEAYLNLGAAFLHQGKLEEAIQSNQECLRLQPNFSTAHQNLGIMFHRLGKTANAIAACEKSIELAPNNALAYTTLGSIHNSQGRFDDAITALNKAVQLKPDAVEAYTNLSYAFYKKRKLEEAANLCRKVLELEPGNPIAYRSLAQIESDGGNLNQAISFLMKELELRTCHLEPGSQALELGRLLVELKRIPVLYQSVEEIKLYRDNYICTLNKAKALVSSGLQLNKQEREVITQLLFNTNNFHLSYQQLDDKEILCSYSELATSILEPDIKPFLTGYDTGACVNSDRFHTTRNKIRLGLASNLLGHHIGSKWAYYLLRHLPREDYEIYLYCLQGMEDDFTKEFASLGRYRWLPFEAGSYLHSCQIIKEDELDILLISDVGMTAQSRILSLLRLAPIQCVGKGHPVTTGSKNIDFFLSSQLMETEDSDKHYSEKLVRVANNGWYVKEETLPSTHLPRSAFGIPEEAVVYGAVQSLFKYLPQYDYIFPTIAKQVPNAFFVFVGYGDHEVVNNAFAGRLKKAFLEAGVCFEDHVAILPRMSFEKFLQLLNVLDVDLDTIGWNGGSTTRLSLAANLPKLTIAGEFMRERHGIGMFKMIGLDELVTHSLDEYVELAIKLGTDKEFRLDLRRKIKEIKHKLFNDTECLEYLDEFFKSEVTKLRQRA